MLTAAPACSATAEAAGSWVHIVTNMVAVPVAAVSADPNYRVTLAEPLELVPGGAACAAVAAFCIAAC